MGDPVERFGSEGLDSTNTTVIKDSSADDLCIEIDPPLRESVATAEDWRKALNKVVPAIVVIRITSCRAFDTESASASSSTGFIIDKRRGIILTNRHVVKPGPVVTEAMLLNREEVPVYPIYRDLGRDILEINYPEGPFGTKAVTE